jgi:16S rRNA (guanine527-N7)-methyltransferase
VEVPESAAFRRYTEPIMTDDTKPSSTIDPYPHDTLAAALARHGIALADDQAALLDRYCRALWDWNEKLNLTRHTTYEKFVARDVVDTLALSPFIEQGDRVIDVGTGGGVPGVVLKIVRPDLQMTLTESVAKKARAVDDIVRTIGLDARVHHGRAEDVLATRMVETLVVRAVAPLAKLVTWFAPHGRAFRRMLVIKGPGWVEERHEARQRHLMNHWQLRKLAGWPLPGTDNQSVLLELRHRDGVS